MRDEPEPSGSALRHHFSKVAQNRLDSPLKSLYKYAAVPDMIPMAGGLPSATLFPFETLEAVCPKADAFPVEPKAEPSSLTSTWSWLLSLFSSRTFRLAIPKYADKGVDIARSLQYSSAAGFPALVDFLATFTRKVHDPPPKAKHTCIMSAGNTSAWALCVNTFCEPGDAIICEASAYSSALATALPFNITAVGVDLDDEGLVPSALDDILSTWEPEKRDGRRKPHVLYTVPTGQNPTGVTMSLKRKQEIYEICCRHDVLIAEDDPYWNIQMPDYQSDSAPPPFIPSFLNCDVEGRVVRMDTFSKTIAPGSRLGWITCNELFAERLVRGGQCEISMPCGFAQAMITQLLVYEWKLDGWLRWLDGNRAQYTARRDLCIDLLFRHFHVRGDAAFSYGLDFLRPSAGFVGYSKNVGKSEKHSSEPLIGFRIPSGGMFVWLRVYYGSHPDFDRLLHRADEDKSAPSPVEVLTERLFVRLAESKLLVAPGFFFDVLKDRRATSGHLRLSFSNATRDQMEDGIETLSRVLTRFMQS